MARLTTAHVAIPTTSQERTALPSQTIDRVGQMIAEVTGGFSVGHLAEPVRAADGRIISEKSYVYELAIPEDRLPEIWQLGRRIADYLGQTIHARIGGEGVQFEKNAVHPVLPLAPVPTTPSDWPGSFDIAIQTVIGPELRAVQTHFNIEPQRDVRSVDGTFYWQGRVKSSITGSSVSIVVACQATPGNEASATAAERLINRWKPKMVFLMGIAAGVRKRCRIGDVVIPRAVVDDTLGVVEGGQRSKRPRISIPPLVVRQQMENFRLDVPKWHARLLQVVRTPTPLAKKKKKKAKKEMRKYEKHVAAKPKLREAAIYSSDLLLRDPEHLQRHIDITHQQIRIGEMEAAGFVHACHERPTPCPWNIVRAVSDFGDEFKNDDFHVWAANAAASYLRCLIEDGIRVDLLGANS